MASKGKERIDDDEEPAAAPPNKKKAVIKWILIVLGVLVLVAASIAATMYFMNSSSHGKDAAHEAGQSSTGKTTKEEKEKSKQPKVAIYYKIDPPFVVNFQGQSGTRFLQVAIELMTYDQEAIAAIEMHMPVIRNNIVFLLSGANYEQINTLEGKQKLRADTLAEIQKILKDKIGRPGVEEVYFTSIVMQ